MAENFVLRMEEFGGLQISESAGCAIPLGKSPRMLNFKINGFGALEKRKGYRKLFEAPMLLRGFWVGCFGGKEYYLAVVGDTLYASKSGFDTLSPLTGTVPGGEEKVNFFSFYDGIYLLTGAGIRRFDGEALSEIQPYVPTVMVATEPNGAGTVFEEPNLLTPYCKQIFSATGEHVHFFPFTREIDTVVSVKIDGFDVPNDQYYWDGAYMKLVFLKTPPKGTDNVEVLYRLLREDVSHRIFNCRFAVGFGGANDTRVFLYGNPDSPAVRYHSGVVDGKPSFAYFPELGYTLVGSGSPITSILRHYDRQLIFTEGAAYYSYLEYMTGESGKLVAAFPVLPLSDDRGCAPKGQALLMENLPCTLTETGLFQWISTNIRDERNAQCFSSSIAHALQQEKAQEALLFFRKATSELYVCFSGRLYVYHSGMKLFYYYEIPKILDFAEQDTDLYFATSQGIFIAEGESDDGEPIPVYWESGAIPFGDPAREKNVYGVTLFCEGEGGSKGELSLAEEGSEREVKREINLSEGKEFSTQFTRIPLRRLQLFRIRLESEGEGALRIRGIRVKGRMIRT
ncbi:MAG: hypothetical protein IKJ74_02925 [Clostridia bacterium]|nr:hypothetical protein [Clostridia bacterium]